MCTTPRALFVPAATWVALSLVACDSPKPPAGSAKPPPMSSSGASRVDIITVESGTVDARSRIRSEQERAQRDGRVLVVYVGAPWCEPCQRFHAAAAAGELDSTFPTLRLLEFDRDRHEDALRDARCLSELIPLFARPTPDGSCSDDRVEGAIKGAGAVGFITPRLQRILRN